MDSDAFVCLLDEQPTHLVPERLLHGLKVGESSAELTFNPCCRLAGQPEPPAGLLEAEQILPKSNNAGQQLVWVQEPAMRRWDPFWVEPDLADAIDRVRSDADEIAALRSQDRVLLEQARSLVPPTYAASCHAAWKRNSERSRQKFQADGYAPISGLIHPFHLGELRRYVRRKIRTGKVRLRDGQSPLRFIAHNDPAARFFHVQLTKAMSDLVGEPVKPSYVYMASYQSGARLEQHTDRAQCEFSLTLCLDYVPEPSGPLHGRYIWKHLKEPSPSIRPLGMDFSTGEQICRTIDELWLPETRRHRSSSITWRRASMGCWNRVYFRPEIT